ncbi:hypothetical protein ACHAXT_004942 [Thalassiosira profunda]
MRLHIATLLLVAAPGETHAGKPTNAGPPPQGGSDPGPGEPSFTDDLTSFDTTRWAKADGWGNGDVFDNGWRAENVAFGADGMTITLDDTLFTADGNDPNPDTYPYTSGELRTTGYHGYGCYEVTMKPVAESGVVSAFFTYAGQWDNPDGGNGQHDEIDIEFLGRDTNHFQANYWTNGVGGHEVEVNLGFDASEDFHRYGFKWKASGIEWWVDGIKVYEVDDATSGSDPVPKITDMTQKIMMNLWPLSSQEAADALFRDAEILAPMVRASTTPLRTLALSYGASLTFTEELVDRSITPTERIVNEELGTIDYRVPKHTYSKKVQRRLDNDKDNPDYKNGAIILRIDPAVERNKLIYQIGTGESSLALEAATKVIQDVNGMDVNMGCPKKFSVSGGMGSALLSDTKRACDIISTLRRNLSKPVSAKIRLLDPEDPRPTLDFVRALIKAGANAITIHGRIVGDESHTQARWPTLVEVVRQLKQTETVPITVNGDLYTRADIREMKRRTGCDGVMLARPALYNISLFRRGDDEQTNASNGQECADEMDLAEFQTTNHAGHYGYHSPLLAPRTKVVQDYISHCVRYRAHSKNAKYVVCEILSSRRTPTNRVPYMNMTFEGGQTIDKVCKCRNLQDLAKLWDVRWTLPRPGKESAAAAGKAAMDLGEVEAHGDQHRYDDIYFLDHEKFRKERTAAVDAQTAEAAAEEKKTDDSEDGPAAKRTKV